MRARTVEQVAYVSRSRLAGLLDVSESTVDEMVRRGVLPRPVRLSPGCVRWRWETVDLALASIAEVAADTQSDPYMAGLTRAKAKAANGH
jgi:predicted DNA-binding transcriptional regulator AlpA